MAQSSVQNRLGAQPTLYQQRLQEQKKKEALAPKTSSSLMSDRPSPTFLAPKPIAPPTVISTEPLQLPWCEKYAPKTMGQLAMHAAKVSALVDTLSAMLKSCMLNRSKQFDTVIPGVRVLILTGPTGTAKSTAIKLLLGSGLINELLPLEKFNVDLIEYLNPVQYTTKTLDELDYGDTTHNFGIAQQSSGWSSTYESKLKPFLQQLQSQKYPSLSISGVQPVSISTSSSKPPSGASASSFTPNTDGKLKVLLVDDMPYLHDWRQKTDFQNAIKSILQGRDYNPIIFILSHTQSTDTSTPWQLFSRDILEHPSVKMLDFNPVNARLIQKALSAILKEEKVVLPKEDLLSLVETSGGDIRSAINSLQWMVENAISAAPSQPSRRSAKSSTSLVPTGPEYTKTQIMKKSTASKSSGKEEYVKVNVYASLSRDVSLSLFHSLGKIMYNKRLKTGDIDDAGNEVRELLDHGVVPKSSPLFRMPLKASPETIHASNVGHDSSGGLLMHYMHENYIKFFGELEDVSQAIGYLSFADSSFSGYYRDAATISEYADLVAMRGILFANAHPRERGFTSLVKPQSLQAFRTLRDNLEIVDLIYASPNLELDVKPGASGPAFTRSRRSGSSSSDEGKGMEVEVIGRGELPLHHPSFISRSQVATDLMPYQGFIMREMALRNPRQRNTIGLRPSEKSFVDVLCRFSSVRSGGAFSSSPHGAAIGEMSSVDDVDEYETTVKDRDRKRMVMENILRERKIPLQLGTLSPFFSSSSTAASSSAVSSSIYTSNAHRPSPQTLHPNPSVSPSSSVTATTSISHSSQASSSSQLPMAPIMTSTPASTPASSSSFRLGRLGGLQPTPLSPAKPTVSSTPSVVNLLDDIVD
jgi:DNA polymerase III delta prime subunit